MFTGIRSLRGVVSLAAVVAVVSLASDVPAQAPTYQLQLSPEDTSLNIDTASYSARPLLTAYTWPDNRVANAILLKFDLSTLPAGATVEQAVVKLALVETDATADTTYTMMAHKLVGKNPVIAAATGYTTDGVTPWTPSGCCYNGVPLAQSDISAPYAVLAVDKTPGVKTWPITTMVREWLATPASNFGLVLNSDATVARDRYRYFASTKHADPTLWPVMEITYSLPGRYDAAGDLRRRLVVDHEVGGDDQLVDRRGQRLADRIRIDDRIWQLHRGERRVGHRTQPAPGRAVGSPRLPLSRAIARRRGQPGDVGRSHVQDARQNSAGRLNHGAGRRHHRPRHRHFQRPGVRQRRRRQRPVPGRRREPRGDGHGRAVRRLVEHGHGDQCLTCVDCGRPRRGGQLQRRPFRLPSPWPTTPSRRPSR